jgi:hypothetical protein
MDRRSQQRIQRITGMKLFNKVRFTPLLAIDAANQPAISKQSLQLGTYFFALSIIAISTR